MLVEKSRPAYIDRNREDVPSIRGAGSREALRDIRPAPGFRSVNKAANPDAESIILRTRQLVAEFDMHTRDQPILRDIVLAGGGHSHVGVLRRFGMNPIPGVRLTVICTDTHTPYSGMLPGYIAGHYGYDEVHIDLRRLAEFAGAYFLRDEVIGLDRRVAKVLCRNRPPVPYDRLSINIGSTPQLAWVEGAVENA